MKISVFEKHVNLWRHLVLEAETEYVTAYTCISRCLQVRSTCPGEMYLLKMTMSLL